MTGRTFIRRRPDGSIDTQAHIDDGLDCRSALGLAALRNAAARLSGGRAAEPDRTIPATATSRPCPGGRGMRQAFPGTTVRRD